MASVSRASIIKEIQDHLEQYRTIKPEVYHLSTEDVSVIRGCSIRRTPDLDYNRSWAKLAKAQRLNRLMNYHQKLTKDYQLDNAGQHQLKSLFYDGINSDILDRDNVNYNSNEGVIIKIDGLKRDPGGIFYFDRQSDTKPSPIQTIHKFTPVPVTKLSLAQKKPKPVIKEKK